VLGVLERQSAARVSDAAETTKAGLMHATMAGAAPPKGMP